jgi:chaperone modulatory protein CbpM
MNNENLIALDEICIHHQVDASFIHSLKENGLIEVIVISEAFFIDSNQLPQLEKYIEFHYSLDINLEGIETIANLLEQINGLQEEVSDLKNKLEFYEC